LFRAIGPGRPAGNSVYRARHHNGQRHSETSQLSLQNIPKREAGPARREPLAEWYTGSQYVKRQTVLPKLRDTSVNPVERSASDGSASAGGPTPALDSSSWVQFFRRLGVRWTKELDFVLVPGGFVLGLFVLTLLDVIGQGWASQALKLPVLLAIALFNAGWALWTLRQQAGMIGNGYPGTSKRLHDAWRARTIAWDVLAVSLIGVGLVVIDWAGPSRFIPTGDLPVVEIAVLVATVALLATFARYTAMAFSTDMDSLVTNLETLSRQEAEQRARETERLAGAFRDEIAKLLERVDKQIAATDSGLQAVTGQLEVVSKALAAQAKASEEIAAAQKAFVETQRQAADAAAKREEQRRKDARDADLKRKAQILPTLRIRLGYEGVVFHKMILEIQNQGGSAEGVNIEIQHDLGTIVPRPTPLLASGGTLRIDLGDVSGFELTATLNVGVSLRDEDANRYTYRGSVGFVRSTGFWGQTKTISVTPDGWVPMTLA
jgi:hypothetical protein